MPRSAHCAPRFRLTFPVGGKKLKLVLTSALFGALFLISGCSTQCEAIVEKDGRWGKHEVLECAQCGWRARWADYLKTYQDKHLVGGGAVAFHEEYVAQFERARAPREKMLAIDRVIHCFHWELKNNPVRAAARELIYAKNYQELLTFLDTLTYGTQSTPGLQDSKREWDRKLRHGAWHQLHRELGFGEADPDAAATP